MKSIILLAVLIVAYANSIEHIAPVSSYGYNRRVSIPLGVEIRKAEEAYLSQPASGRIAGGNYAEIGKFPYHAGVLTSFYNESDLGVCGGSLVTASRVIYAAHCWWDGDKVPYGVEVVLGSIMLFNGGTRMTTSDIVLHPEWDYAYIARHDVGIIFLPSPVEFSSTISPIALPSGNQLNENFIGEIAVASGFGRTSDDPREKIIGSQTLKHAQLEIVPNSVCSEYFVDVQDANICVSGAGGRSTCPGDSGGPLVIFRNDQPLLIGITSYGSTEGCVLGYPAAFSRVTHFMGFFNQYL